MGNYPWEIEEPHRCQTMENDGRTRHGIPPIRKEQRQCHIITGGTQKKLPQGEPRRGNYSVLGYMQRHGAIGDTDGETKGILVEWGEVGR